MKKKFMENKKFRLIAVFLVTVFIVGGFSLAWFYVRKHQYDLMSVSNFQATPVCTFDGTDKSFVDKTDGLIVLSTNPEDANYIGKFRVKVDYTGDGVGYLRVRMVHEFSNGSESVQHPAKLPYATSSTSWFDNRDRDYCYYYSDKLNVDDNETKSIELITGLGEGGAEIVQGFEDANAVIKVAVEADMVQVNRYPQIWGMNEIPKN